MTERAKFEAWAITQHLAIYRNGGEQYVNTATQHVWDGWKACALAAPSQPEGAEPTVVQPSCYWIEKAEQFAMPPKDGSKLFARAWKPLYDTKAMTEIESAAFLRGRTAGLNFAKLSAGAAAPDEGEDAFPALHALTEAILTRADADFMQRRLTEAVRVMATHGWEPPVPFPAALSAPKGEEPQP